MTRSSGQRRTTEKHLVECDGRDEHTDKPCTFAGVVDVEVDPEVRDAWWDCPRCGTQNDLPDENPSTYILHNYWH